MNAILICEIYHNLIMSGSPGGGNGFMMVALERPEDRSRLGVHPQGRRQYRIFKILP